jgi:hypothetical protein
MAGVDLPSPVQRKAPGNQQQNSAKMSHGLSRP